MDLETRTGIKMRFLRDIFNVNPMSNAKTFIDAHKDFERDSIDHVREWVQPLMKRIDVSGVSKDTINRMLNKLIPQTHQKNM